MRSNTPTPRAPAEADITRSGGGGSGGGGSGGFATQGSRSKRKATPRRRVQVAILKYIDARAARPARRAVD
jgi:hypothetical protein